MAFVKPKEKIDVSVMIGETRFNFRASCIVLSSNKQNILVNLKDGFVILPGGRVKAGETTDECIIREVAEELHVEFENLKLKLVMENQFVWQNKNVHELQYFYYGTIKNNRLETLKDVFYSDDGQDTFKWVPVSELDKYNYLPRKAIKYIEEAKRGNFEIKHSINKEN